jgi:hypothetical protein
MIATAAATWFTPRREFSAAYGAVLDVQPRYRVYQDREIRTSQHRGALRTSWLIRDLMIPGVAAVSLGGRPLRFHTERAANAWLAHCVALWAAQGPDVLAAQTEIPDDWWSGGQARWLAEWTA